MKTYLVTGAAGFIGAAVARQLLLQGYTACGLDNLNAAYDISLKHWRLQQLRAFPHFSFYPVDIAHRAQLEESVRHFRSTYNCSFEAILHLAARARVRASVEDPWAYIDTNITGTQNLLELARRQNTEKFVLASTSSVYGTDNSLPFGEEGNSSQPLSPYAASKKAAEVLCYTYSQLHALDVTVLRYFTVYGPAGRPDMSLFRFVHALYRRLPLTIYGDGRQKRDFTYIDDIAAGTIAALRPVGFEVVNLGSDRPIYIDDLVALLEKVSGMRAIIQYAPSHPADVPATWANIDKAQSLLNWRPQTTFERGIEQFNQWYCRERTWLNDIQL